MLFEIFPNLTGLYLMGNIFPFQEEGDSGEHFEIIQSYPSLRRMATCIDEACMVPKNAFSSPFWTTITHLQLECLSDISSNMTTFQLPLFTAMTSLTHLALSSSSFERTSNVGLALSRVRETFPPSLILCLLGLISPLFKSSRHQLVEITDTYLKNDERIVMWWTGHRCDVDKTVVVNRTDSFEGSCRVQGGLQTFWEMGEAVLKRRRERLQTI
ncbi:hypothetical protein DL96DRAFT_1018828 [Flagelloscypha sp. PMI_526]|nr:hypothetical protein DL96DRAFT_1018828 [Flagelloscypha sp. PMI_526]